MAKRVAIIGGGPSGIIAAKAIALEPEHLEIDIFERQETFGGIWNYHEGQGPVYRDLKTNVPRDLIGFGDDEFPSGQTNYASRQEFFEYIKSYSEKTVVEHANIRVHFNSNVDRVEKVDGKWKITANHSNKGDFDFVLIATGHYDYPNWPDVPGLRDHPSVIHSREYEVPDPFINKKNLILANSRSGMDLLLQLLQFTAPITVSRHRVGPLDEVIEKNDPNAVRFKEPVTSVHGSEVFFADGSHEHFDNIIVSTGYLYDAPFLIQDEDGILDKNRFYYRNVYKHILYIPDPTLAVIGTNKHHVPLPTSSTQAEIIARVWGGRLSLPSKVDQNAHVRETLHQRGDDPYKYHELPNFEDIDYLRDLWAWSDEAPGGFSIKRWSPEKQEYRKGLWSTKDALITAVVQDRKSKREAYQRQLPGSDSVDPVQHVRPVDQGSAQPVVT